MSNILFLYEREMPTVSLMKIGFESVFEANKSRFMFKTVREFSSEDMVWLDVIVLIRPNNSMSSTIASKAKKLKKTVVFYMDDDLLNLPQNMPKMPWRQNALRKIMAKSDVFLSSSHYLCEKYTDYTFGKRAVQLDTVVTKEELDSIPEKSDNMKVRIVYAAGANHEGLFMKYINPILPKLSEKYGDKISVSFVGVHPEINCEELAFEINYYSSMPLIEYREFMKTMNFDIGLSPLHTDSFTKCKYINKYIEYTLVGTVGVYSRTEPYTYAIQDGINGLLAENNPDSWFDTLSMLIEDKVLREKCYRAAIEDLENNFDVNSIRSKLFSEIPELLFPHKGTEEKISLIVSKVAYGILRLCDCMYLVIFYFRTYGLKDVLNRIKYRMTKK